MDRLPTRHPTRHQSRATGTTYAPSYGTSEPKVQSLTVARCGDLTTWLNP